MHIRHITKEESDTLKKRATIASISVALALCLLKLAASLYTGSLSVLSSMVDSLSDIIGSLVTFAAIRVSIRPASNDYRYGYGKSEALSGLVQSAFIAGSGLFIIYDGFNRFLHPRAIQETAIGIAVMIISLIATLILISYQKYVLKRTRSQAIKADSAHYVVDILTNSSILLTLVVVKLFDIVWFDTLTAILISCYLLHNAYDLACEAVNMLLDKELDEKIRKNIENTVNKMPFAKGIHDLRTRDLGGTYLFEFHLELDGKLTLSQAHNYAHEVENKILKKYPNAQVIIHQEPVGIKEDRLDNKL